MLPPDGPNTASLLRRNRDRVLERLRAAAEGAGRDPRDVRLIAVTKSVDVETALALAALGQEDLGESRVDALERKADAFARRGVAVRWHFIGHLQRNKARRVARIAHAIHAVDTPELLHALERIGREEDVRPQLYLQVKVSDEPTKHGLPPDAVPGLVADARARGVRLAGLMAMAPLAPAHAASAAAAAAFERVAALARTLDAGAFLEGRPRLSIGMSGDLAEAVRAGAHDVRVGTALFADAEDAA